MKRSVVALLTLLTLAVVLAAGAWFFATPYLAVRAMRNAADAKDAAALSSYVDYPAVRESLKASMRSKLGSMTATAPDNPLAALANIASAFADPMIDTLVTPESLSAMLAGNVPERAGHFLAASSPGADVETSMGYSSYSSFVLDVKGKGTPGAPIEFVLTRTGLATWKLTGVRLP